jgi:hypothetical protein
MRNIIYVECHKQALYAECQYAECRYAECHYTECRGALPWPYNINFLRV